jgi:branched-subunit amino acid aminotransferase/4-amino-4-deoxychorismate lyase
MTQAFDSRNKTVLNWVDGEFIPRFDPAIPVYDSGFMHGKQVWSSPRLVKRRVFRLLDHLNKIHHAAALNFWPRIPSDEEIIAAVRATLIKNKMEDGVHIRIMLTAGNQLTASMDIGNVVDDEGNPSQPRIIIAPEYRSAVYDAGGISAITSSFLRASPDTVDQRSHDNNQNASARACYEAKQRNATTAIMYDAEGFLAEAFASHVAIVRDGVLVTPLVRCCPEGVTRRVILELCYANGISAEEADISQAEVEEADEIFIMGTMSGPVAVTTLDDRPVGDGQIGLITKQLYDLYAAALTDEGQSYPILS